MVLLESPRKDDYDEDSGGEYESASEEEAEDTPPTSSSANAPHAAAVAGFSRVAAQPRAGSLPPVSGFGAVNGRATARHPPTPLSLAAILDSRQSQPKPTDDESFSDAAKDLLNSPSGVGSARGQLRGRIKSLEHQPEQGLLNFSAASRAKAERRALVPKSPGLSPFKSASSSPDGSFDGGTDGARSLLVYHSDEGESDEDDDEEDAKPAVDYESPAMLMARRQLKSDPMVLATLKEWWLATDADGNGSIDREEYIELMKAMCVAAARTAAADCCCRRC